VLHQEGLQKPVSDLFGKAGRRWLATAEMSAAARQNVDSYLELIDHLQPMVARAQRAALTAIPVHPASGFCAGKGKNEMFAMLARIGQLVHPVSREGLLRWSGGVGE